MTSSQPTPPKDLEALRAKGMELYEAGKVLPAYKRLQSYVLQVLSFVDWRDASLDQSWIEAFKAYSDCSGEADVWLMYERLGLGDASTVSNLGYALKACEQWCPAIDYFRLAYMREPSNLSYRLQLAMELVTCPDFRLRNATEAARLLKELKDLPWNDDVLAIEASIAAENGSFLEATGRQSSLVERSAGITRILQNLVLDRYHEQLRFPGFIERTIKPQHQLWHSASILLGTPMVHVCGRAMYVFDDGSSNEPRIVEHLHSGLTLTRFGDILICCTTLRIPPYADPQGRKVSKASWLEGPFIRVYGERAEIVGADHASGLALIRMAKIPNPEQSRSLSPTDLAPIRPLTSEPIPNLETLRQELLDTRPLVNHRHELTEETAFESKGLDIRREVQEVGSGVAESIITRNHWNEPEERRVGTWIRINSSDLIIGAPLVNQASARVAMIDEVYTDQGPIKVGIPAEVISRVAAKLLCFGRVERVSVPILVSAVDLEHPRCEPYKRRFDESVRLRGMQITGVSNRPDLEQELKGLIITHIDDVPVPDNTAWQIVLEKAAIMKHQSLECIVYDRKQNLMRAVSIPIDPPK